MFFSIQDLANIATILNYSATVINHGGIVKNAERKEFESKQIELQRVFVDGLKNLNTDVLTSPSSDNFLTMVKIGDDSYHPTPADLQKWKEVFEQARADKDFTIVTHPAVTVERVNMGRGFPASTLKVVGFTPKDQTQEDQLSLDFDNKEAESSGFVGSGGDINITGGFDGYGSFSITSGTSSGGNITILSGGLTEEEKAIKKAAEEEELRIIDEMVEEAKKGIASKKRKNPSIKKVSEDD